MDKEMRQAIKNDSLELVKQLLTFNNELLNVITVFGTWLHVAASQGKLDIAEYLVDCGMDVNKNGDISGGGECSSKRS